MELVAQRSREREREREVEREVERERETDAHTDAHTLPPLCSVGFCVLLLHTARRVTPHRRVALRSVAAAALVLAVALYGYRTHLRNEVLPCCLVVIACLSLVVV